MLGYGVANVAMATADSGCDRLADSGCNRLADSGCHRLAAAHGHVCVHVNS